MTFLVRILGASVCFFVILGGAEAQAFGEQCLDKFKNGKEDFVLDADDSLKDGATFLSAPKVDRVKDCIRSCCKEPKCNVAFMEKAQDDDDDMVKSCFLFDCLYKQTYVCRFVVRKGYLNYILDSLFESELAPKFIPEEVDHPPKANGGPDRVAQPHESLALNGIESKDDHEIATYRWDLKSGNPSVLFEKSSFKDQVLVSNLVPGVYIFELTVTDSSGQSDQAQVTVLVLTPEQSEHQCLVPKKSGPCRGSFPRWHYNAVSRNCEEFVFGGCKANSNNYLTLKECTTACSGVSVMPHPSGNGSRKFGPGSDSKEVCGVSCESGQFTCSNGCCVDTAWCDQDQNQCSDGSDEQYCKDLRDQFEEILKQRLDEQQVRCTAHPKTGTCRQSFSRWYYNPLHTKCFRFNYGGCDGNRNQFETEEECMNFCKTVKGKDVFESSDGIFDKRETDNQTSILVIVALLCLAIVILLVVLCYCFLKRRNELSSRQRAPVSSPPHYTKVDSDRLVYNTTTKPI